MVSAVRMLSLGLAGVLLATLAACVPVSGEAEPSALDCARLGEPCTLAQASPEALQLTRTLTQVAADFLGAGAEPQLVAEQLATLPAVVESGWDELGIFFRVEDAPPAWVMLEELDGRAVDGGWVSSQLSTGSTASTAARARTVSAPGAAAATASSPIRFASTEPGGATGIAGTPGEGKRLLVVSPHGFDQTSELVPVLEADRDFSQRGGMVESRVRADKIDPAAAIDTFRGWDAFDSIILATHGLGVCQQGDDGELLRDADGDFVGCRTVLSAGPVLGTLEEVTEAIGEVPGVVIVESVSRINKDLPEAELSRLLQEVCLPGIRDNPSPTELEPCTLPYPPQDRPIKVGATADFFATVYPGGLPDRFIALMACHSMRFDDVASRLHGGDGIVLGFPMIVWSEESALERAELVKTLLRGVPTADAVTANLARQPASDVGAPRFRHLGNEALRIRDVVALFSGENELRDGAMVPLMSTPDGEPATELTVRVSRVGDEEQAAQFTPEIWVDGKLAFAGVELKREFDGEWFSEPVTVPLPEGFEPGDVFTAEARVALPSGGESRWRYENLTSTVTVRFTSHVWFDTGEASGEGKLVAEGPLEHGANGWQASLPMRWEIATVSGLPPQCSVGEVHAVSTFEVRGGSLQGDGAILQWGVGTGGSGLQDRIDVDCGIVGSFGQGFGTTLGIGGMLVVHGDELTENSIWVADDFAPSTEPGVRLVHRMEGTEGEIRNVLTIEFVESSPTG